MAPEILIAIVTVLGAITGAAVGQMPAFLSRRAEANKRTHDQNDRWESKAFELAEQILQHASQLDMAIRREEQLEGKELVATSKWARLDIALEGSLSRLETPSAKNARLACERFTEEVKSMREDLKREKKGHVDSIWKLKGPLSTYLPKESHIALISLAFEAEKRLMGASSSDLDGAILAFSVALREDFLKAPSSPRVGLCGLRSRAAS